jgi:isopenicillin-N N-acyltransferase-like protein
MTPGPDGRADPPMSTLEQVQVEGSDYEAGFAIGSRFAVQIRRALESYPFLQEQLLYHRSPEGQARNQELQELNRARYPDHFAELEGLAEGSRYSFEELFLVNMRGEYRGYMHSLSRGCSNCTLLTENAALIGHNEDGSPSFRGNLYVVHARIEGKPAFTALSYPGFLCGNAFGFNAEGVCFSVDHVRPRHLKVGLGRHFIARSLLEAESLDDAIRRVTVPARASGFSYTIGSIPERRIVQAEVAPESHHVVEIRGARFHANHYLELGAVDNMVEPSSRARVERAQAILRRGAPANSSDVLSILGDQEDKRYPLYRTAAPPDTYATLCTALFDLDARRLRIYTGHPTRAADQFVELGL